MPFGCTALNRASWGALAPLPEWAVAFQGPLSGDFAWVGENLCASVEIALAHAHEDGLLARPVALRRHDSGGRPELAPKLARAIAGDPAIVALVGPTFSREVAAAGDVLAEAGLPFLVPVATRPDLGDQGWGTFFRLVASDAARAPLTAYLMRDELGVEQAAVVSDESESGRRLAGLLDTALVETGVAVVHRSEVRRHDDSYREAGRAVASSGADGLYFAGEYREAALLRRELAENGSPVAFVSDDGVLTPKFVEAAGPAAEGCFVTFPGADAETVPRLGRDFKRLHGRPPAAFATEAYQAATLVACALAEGGTARGDVHEYLAAFAGDVAGRRLTFDADGECVPQIFYAYEVADGAWTLRRPLTAPALRPGGTTE